MSLRRIRRHWPTSRISFRGDGHYGRPEAMEWCEANGVDYIFGLAGNEVLACSGRRRRRRSVRPPRRERGRQGRRTWTETRYAAKTWTRERRVVARIEADAARARHPLRRHHRSTGTPEWLYETSIARAARPRT